MRARVSYDTRVCIRVLCNTRDIGYARYSRAWNDVYDRLSKVKNKIATRSNIVKRRDFPGNF